MMVNIDSDSVLSLVAVLAWLWFLHRQSRR